MENQIKLQLHNFFIINYNYVIDTHTHTYIYIRAIPQKMLPQDEKGKLTNKGCFPKKINKEVLPFDDGVKKVGNNMSSIILYFSAIKRAPYFARIVAKTCF